MKSKFLLSAVFVILFFKISNAENEKIVKANVDKVTIYLQGAQIYCKANFNLLQGTNRLVFEGVSGSLDQNSIQANGKGDFTILDVQYNTKYVEAIKKNSPIEKIKLYQQQIILVDDSIENTTYDLTDVANKKAALSTEKNMLLTNRIIKGETKKDSLNLLKESMIFLREKLFNIDAELLRFTKLENKLSRLNYRLNQRKSDLQNIINTNGETIDANAKMITQVIVTVLAEVPAQAQISISYYCVNAGWLPQYELRANSDANKIQLKHLAQIYQTTGVDWTNAELTLSTGNPNQSNTLPTLSPYWLAYFQQVQRYNKKVELDKKTIGYSMPATLDDAKDMEVATTGNTYDAKTKFAQDFVQTTQSILRTDYLIKLNYNIPSDGKQHVAIIQTKEVSTAYEFTAIPKLDRNAFLMAKIFNWEDLNLMQAQANIFFDGTYLGKTYINPTETNDTLELNVGRDNGIVMERKLIKEKSKEKNLAGEKIATKTYQITIRNTKNSMVVLNVMDQIPLSNDNTIKIELTDAGGGNIEETTGELKWKLNLKAHDVRKLTFTYVVKSVSNKPLNAS